MRTRGTFKPCVFYWLRDNNTRTAPENQDELQPDLSSVLRFNAELIKTVEAQQKTIQQLREELNPYRRKLLGTSSERHVEDESQLLLFDVGDQACEEDDDDKPKPPKPKNRRRNKKSEKLPAHLRREIIEAGVSPKDRMCSCCGEEMPKSSLGKAVR